ncbi:hypothetical protein Q1695_003064 [Nippostrongylus brasiliensis]|nr:hypothetical protein Q1695_003064 [Nippostrongylus brasiliensis]
MWPLLLFALPSVFGVGVDDPICNATVDMGEADCDKATSIRYHYDVDTQSCLAFRFTGCGGNSNNFPTRSQCFSKCRPLDYYLNCPADEPEVKRADGSSNCNFLLKCPEGSSCQRGFLGGVCCKDREEPDCGSRKLVTVTEGKVFWTVLYGKSCDHHFCPEGAECHGRPSFAYCCQ